MIEKVTFKPGTMLNPVPAVMVSCGSTEEEHNIITVGWTGIVNTEPPMTYVSVRRNRHSHDIIERNGEFVINLTTEDLVKQTDWCGVRSGKNEDKFKAMQLTKMECDVVKCPMIGESPVNLECKVVEQKVYGTHDMFIAEIVAVHVNKALMDENDRFCLEKAGLMAYSHGHYYGLQKKPLGRFGFSVMKPKTAKKLKGQERENARKQFASKKKKGNEKKQNPSKKPNKK
ncbi:MAG: flavin reductase family protein [Firmicutes bacterium]|nr:flavin reductase family protein [Bacillota bacterium]MBQ2270292.1 flavin reductase family protein [Bacillota bacterium]MBQ5797735.1 flavin reductase family protein [Bacillota bacterium]MBR6500368.1 flavin reductase family protein [Bacillota bacterium]